MKKYLIALLMCASGCNSSSTGIDMTDKIVLPEPDKMRGLSFMQTLSVRASAQDWSSDELSLQDLSDLLWAANGVNRPSEGKRTASSAQNAQDIDLYILMDDGVFLYDAAHHALNKVVSGDHRSLVEVTNAPMVIVLVSDISRFRSGFDEYYQSWANIDCGIVSQNISLFCAATGLKTRPKAVTLAQAAIIHDTLVLNETQIVLLHHPVGYKK
jgi:nitroreductase